MTSFFCINRHVQFCVPHTVRRQGEDASRITIYRMADLYKISRLLGNKFQMSGTRGTEVRLPSKCVERMCMRTPRIPKVFPKLCRPRNAIFFCCGVLIVTCRPKIPPRSESNYGESKRRHRPNMEKAMHRLNSSNIGPLPASMISDNSKFYMAARTLPEIQKGSR